MLGLVTLILAPVFSFGALGGFDSARRDFERHRELARNDPYNQNPFRQGRMDSERDAWAGTMQPGPLRHFAQITGMAIGGILLALYRIFRPAIPAILRALSLAFPIFGAFLGAGIAYALYNLRMMRSLMEIERTCELLCAAMTGNDERQI
jgi:hypothetical protein